MWNTLKENQNALLDFFDELEIIRPVSRLDKGIAADLTTPAEEVVPQKETPEEKPKAVNKNPQFNLQVNIGKSSFAKYTFVIQQPFNSLGFEAKEMLQNLIVKGLLLDIEMVEFKIWSKPEIHFFEIGSMGKGCYFIMGINFIGLNGPLKETEMLKQPGILIFTSASPEALNMDKPQKLKLWEMIKQHGR